MEPADILKITMSVMEAEAVINGFDWDDNRRSMGECFGTSIIGSGLTPIQAQAILVMAWNKVLGSGSLCFESDQKGRQAAYAGSSKTE
jgi:hypothetical protein